MAAKVSLIVAHDNKLGIGANNRLLWNITKDLDRFRQITLGHPVIMGRKTFQSIGRPLPDRTNIIITRTQPSVPHSVHSVPDRHSDPERNVKITHSLKEAIVLAKSIDKTEIFIIGGGEIYRQAMAENLVDRLYITHVQGDFQADTFFPSYSHFKTLISKTSDSENQYQFEYKVLEP
ncbi:MAG: dihydrofolate reductase [Candidatus Beckwithbacteria bacterium]